MYKNDNAEFFSLKFQQRFHLWQVFVIHSTSIEQSNILT